MPEVVDSKTIFSLLEVTRSIQKTIADRYKNLYWIKAEMNKLNHYSHSGHCYPELVEKKDGKIVAEIRSILWKTDFQRINQQFIKLLNEPLRDGITMLFQAGISYDPMYGLSLRIVDIDPTFVLGELEREKKESILKLQQEGIFDTNKKLPFPAVPKRLAIISVETSKGLSDFYKIINNNPWGYRFETTLYPALLQGDKSIPSIIKQLSLLAECTDKYDAVAIIRGGGGEVGLSSYNNYLLAKAIAIFPLPVLTGIGHSTNETVSEMVAYKNAITPSELADFLIQKFHNFAIPLDQSQEKLVYFSKQHFLRERNAIAHSMQQISWSSKNKIASEKHGVLILTQRLQFFSDQFLREKQTSLEHLDRLVKLADPTQLLKRGFSITRMNGKIVTHISQLQMGDRIETIFIDGKITGTVTHKEGDHGQ
ncbi:exodeoxyribonuclease VII large subunit [Sphingobacterium alkalisoli]|uniref:Exodeoxyribonuclease 7 large subunit n=1 Tax=Sphingobacterium alkalisoli TaxID=1874115 RepID=A0A4V5LYU3_9SPHI|nr:exodeoxyribonuclease VII large subunit [Sphingobacterium alkalisoli]TJY67989.1 exodeoxyribonuclease VII large subunit [Sphingobacterium alkalisoli]GGH09846.1 exodeoxyribonuclease 7 large subunit [Sphingobacterium alkalisoli]